jgi:hypothetical protein
MGAGALVIETVVLLMAIVPLAKVGGPRAGWAILAAVLLAVLSVVLAGLLRRRWAWYGGMVLQLALCACVVLNPALAVLGLVFGTAWGYLLHVRRTVLGG